jgi:hypothetical protein
LGEVILVNLTVFEISSYVQPADGLTLSVVLHLHQRPLTPFFVNVANDIGKDVIFDGNSHPSILKIKNNTQHNTLFDFKPTDVDTINKLVSKINIKKATGVDQISSKLLHAGAPVLNKHITTLVNNTIKTSVFPTRLKEAQVVPLHKKMTL